MKGLLQSKRFKQKLYRWIFMYVVTIGLLTTIITYSKYIASMLDGNEAARVAKFNVKLEYCDDIDCYNHATGTYDSLKFRPNGEMVYYFSVDTSEIEVNTDLILTITIDNHFNIKKIEDVTDKDDIKEVTTISNNDTSNKTASIDNSISASTNNITRYKVTLAYDESVVDYNKLGCDETLSNGCKVVNGVVLDEDGNKQYIFDEATPYEILKIGYTAIQEK